MRISNKIIEGVVSEVVGEDSLSLVDALKNKKNVSEFKLAENIKKPINETRNILYRLYHVNLVSFIRRKDKKKGWYIYYWTFNNKKIKDLILKLKKEKTDRLKDRLKRETGGYFFSCENRCIRLDFEQATDFEFKCPECGSLLNQEDNTKETDRIKEEIKELEKELKK